MRMDKDTKIERGKHERPSFLICLPTFGLLPVEWVVSYTRLAIPVNAIAHSHVITNQEIGVARSEFTNVALAMRPRPKAIFFVGDDVLYPWDALLKLWDAYLEHDADVMAGLYFIKHEYPAPILWRRDVVGPLREYRDYQPGDVVSADVVGMDATLINPRIFERIDKPWFKTGPSKMPSGGILTHTEDVWTCDKIKAAGGRVFCHTGVRCSHMNHRTGEVW